MTKMSNLVIITNYIFNFWRMNINTRDNINTLLFFDKKKTIITGYNSLVICPSYFTIYLLLSMINTNKIFSIKAKVHLEDYVSFMRVTFHPQVKSWCDWCSIVNGSASFLIDCINEYFANNPSDHADVNNQLSRMIKKAKNLEMYLHFFFIKEKDGLIDDQMNATCEELFPTIYHGSSNDLKRLLTIIAYLYNLFQFIERQWCPFQHMKRIAMLKHVDQKRYDTYLQCKRFEDIVKAGEIIFKFNHIKCSKCVEQINEHFHDGEHQSNHSPQYQKYLHRFFDMLCELSRAE